MCLLTWCCIVGPWVLGLGLGAWLISKEIYIVGPEVGCSCVLVRLMLSVGSTDHSVLYYSDG